MASKPKSEKKARSARRRVDAGDKDKLIIEQKNRIAFLENELRLKQDDAMSSDFAGPERTVLALRESEERYRSLFEHMLHGFAYCKMLYDDQGYPEDFIYLNVNNAFERLTGLENVVDKRATEVIPGIKEDHPELFEIYGRVAATGKPEQFEIEFKPLAAWLSVSVYSTGRGNFTAVFDNITERKRTVESLNKLRAKLEKSQEIAHLGSWELDLLNNSLYWSDEVYRIFGLQPQEFGATYDAFLAAVHPDDRAAVDAAYSGSVREGRDSYEIEHRVVRRSSGEVRFVHEKCEHFRDESGRIVRSVGMVHDITEHKRVEESLHTTLQRFYTTLSGMYPSILLVTEEGRVEFANQAFCDYFDLEESPGDLMGLTSPEMIEKIKCVYHHPDVEVARIRDIVGRGQPVRGEEVAMRSGRACLRDFVPLYVDGQRYGRLWLHLDITERKRAEIKMEEAKAQAELYIDLMGHDISNMHQIALGYLELARDIQPDVGQTEFIDKPVEVLQRSARLIKNVRKLQKLREGVLQTEGIDLCKVLVDVQREFSEVPDKIVTLNLNGRENCRVRANELLYDVFANLVSNAIKYTGDHANIIVDLDVVEDYGDRYCRVLVEDDGPGIPDDFKGRIFNRLLKGTEKAKGMGLGLYLVKSLVESYGGGVWVEDRIVGDPTKGARFVVMLPAVEK